jgi:hypothetical protein
MNGIHPELLFSEIEAAVAVKRLLWRQFMEYGLGYS